MSNDPQQQHIQKLNHTPLSARLAALTGGGTLTAPVNASDAVSRLQNNTWRGAVFALIDVSASMSGEPLEQAKRGVVDFAKDAISSRYDVGLISFGDDAREIISVTRDITVLNRAARELSVQGTTNMAAAITLATQKLKSCSQERVIFLITDGAPNDPLSTIAAAEAAKKDRIDIITLGTEGADNDFLKKIASRDKLARNVTTANLQIGMASTARLLLERGGPS